MNKLIILLLLIPTPCHGFTRAEIRQKIKTEAIRQGVDYQVMVALAKTESSLNPMARNKEYRNGKYIGESLGLFQVRRITAKEHCGITTTKDLMQIDNNIRCGTTYFNRQLNRYNGNISHAVLAYNRGSLILKKNGKAVNYDYLVKFHKHLMGGRW